MDKNIGSLLFIPTTSSVHGMTPRRRHLVSSPTTNLRQLPATTAFSSPDTTRLRHLSAGTRMRRNERETTRLETGQKGHLVPVQHMARTTPEDKTTGMTSTTMTAKATMTTTTTNAPCLYFRLMVIDTEGVDAPNLKNKRLNSGGESENEMKTEHKKLYGPHKQKQKKISVGPNKQKTAPRVREMRCRRRQRAGNKRWIELCVFCFLATIFPISVGGQELDPESDTGRKAKIEGREYGWKGKQTGKEIIDKR